MNKLIHYHRLENGADIYLYSNKDTLRYVNFSIRKPINNDYDSTVLSEIELFLTENEIRNLANKLNLWLKGDLFNETK